MCSPFGQIANPHYMTVSQPQPNQEPNYVYTDDDAFNARNADASTSTGATRSTAEANDRDSDEY